MTKNRIYILAVWVMSLLTGCEDIFVRQIDFQGETEPEMLVLTGDFQVDAVPLVMVAHSFFFDRTDKYAKDWITDAEVSLSINNRRYALTHRDNGVYANSSIPPLQPLDTLEIVATHPLYATATAKQVMPAQVHSAVVSYELLPTNQMTVQIYLDAYHGNADDVIGIKANAMLRGIFTHSYGNGRPDRTDTLHIKLNTIYSNDIVFAEAENASIEGYYGAYSDQYLYFPASALKEPKRLQVLLDNYQLRWEREYDTVEPVRLEVEVIACTFSEYRFVQSTRNRYYTKYLPAPSNMPEQEENIMQEIMDAIQESLGEQEPVQVYTNVEGGLGHISGWSSDIHSFDF